MKNLLNLSLGLFLLSLTQISSAQLMSEHWDPGTVWSVATVRIEANMEDQYFSRVKQTWGKAMMQAVEQELILDYKILFGNAANEDDHNLILMIEFENYGMLDPDPDRNAKWKRIEDGIKEDLGDKYEDNLEQYGDIREWMGEKLMREISFNYE